jgi:hypothetical protein
MKKLALIGLAFCLVFALTVPAMALDVDFSGFYRVRGFCYHDYESFGYDGWSGSDTSNTLIGTIEAGTEHASDYYDMLLDVNIVFKVHPKLKLITNFTALDKLWGASDNDGQTYKGITKVNSSDRGDMKQAQHEDHNDIDWNQAYMQIVSPVGIWWIGRQTGSQWRHPIADSATDADRIKWALLPGSMGGPSWNPLLIAFCYEKYFEGDAGNLLSDSDTDYYFITLGYQSPNLVIDSLHALIRCENPYTPYNRAYPSGYLFFTGGPNGTKKADIYLHRFYYKQIIGPVKLEAEYDMGYGYVTEPLGNEDIRIESAVWFGQVTYDQGPVDVYGGWAHADGDADGWYGLVTPGDTYHVSTAQLGNDWDLLFFMTSDEGSHAQSFGGIGNWSSAGQNPYGIDLLYLGGGFDVTPTINLSAVWGMGWADAVPCGSKDIGWEGNLWLTWQMMDGLQYKALFAFFDAGDFWEDARSYPVPPSGALSVGIYPIHSGTGHSDPGNCWALMHQLTLSF